jgi:hypothetical protein
MDDEDNQLSAGMVAEADRGKCGEVGAARDAPPVEADWG